MFAAMYTVLHGFVKQAERALESGRSDEALALLRRGREDAEALIWNWDEQRAAEEEGTLLPYIFHDIP